MRISKPVWRALFSCNTRFEIRPFTLLPTTCSLVIAKNVNSTYLIKSSKQVKRLKDEWNNPHRISPFYRTFLIEQKKIQNSEVQSSL